jgi:predicted transcriptional regulator
VNRKQTACLILVVLALTASFTMLMCSTNSFGYGITQSSENPQRLCLTAPIVIGASLRNAAPPLSQPTRLQIYNYIQANPGVHFREICRGLDVSVGVVQYHLDVLVHAKLLQVYADGQNRRYFINGYGENEANLTMLLRHPTQAKILFSLLQSSSALHKDIASSLGISSQALSCHMSQLQKAGLVEAVKEGVNVRYTIIPEQHAELSQAFRVTGYPEL